LRSDFWGAFYHSDWQSFWLLLIVPSLFLLYLVSRRRPVGDTRSRFLHAYALAFTLETLLDLVATGPLVRALGLDGAALTAWIFVFVWLGDFRVLLLYFAEQHGGAQDWRTSARRAAALTCLVPVATGLLYAPVWLGWLDAPGEVLWLVYETLFAALALWLRARAASPAIRAILLYAFAYYALWAAADVLILAGVDVGWGIRAIPNQLYYSLYVPFAWWRCRQSERPA
jgi:hypothetical protein